MQIGSTKIGRPFSRRPFPHIIRAARKTVTLDFLGSMPAGATYARASNAWAIGSGLSLVNYANDAPAWAYDPAGSGVLGLMNEIAATNTDQNPSNNGVTPGTPGAGPTGWAGTGSANGTVAKSTIGSGTEDNIGYVDLKWAGTSSASGLQGVLFVGSAVVAASNGQTWASGMYVKLANGTTSNVSMTHLIQSRTSGGVPTGTQVSAPFTPTTAALKTQRLMNTLTINSGTAANIVNGVLWNWTGVVTFDLTLRIGLPTLELAGAVSSPIVTAGSPVTRAAAILTLTGLASGTYTMAVERVSGTTTLPGQVISGGTWVVPNDPSPVRRVSYTK